jgi:hypothetical protein
MKSGIMTSFRSSGITASAREPPFVMMSLERFLEVGGEIALQPGIEEWKAVEARDESALIVRREIQSLAFLHDDGLHLPGSAKRQGGKKDGHLQSDVSKRLARSRSRGCDANPESGDE